MPSGRVTRSFIALSITELVCMKINAASIDSSTRKMLIRRCELIYLLAALASMFTKYKSNYGKSERLSALLL